MHLLMRQKLSYLTIHIFMFFSGVEYAVVFPTLWEYLQSLGVNPDNTYWLGATISAMTVTDMMSGLFIGRILDLGCNIKLLVLILNTCQIVGAILYLTATSPLHLLGSRLVSGLGKSITIVFLTNICRSTELSERTPILLLFNIAFQIGLLFGPACNLFLGEISVNTVVGHLGKLNSPGLLMGVSWILFSILVTFCFLDLVSIKERIRIQEDMDIAYRTINTDENQILNYEDDIEYEVVTYQNENDINNCHGEEINDNDVDCEKKPLVNSPLYTHVEQTYPCSLPVPDDISPSDINQFKTLVNEVAVKLDEVQQHSQDSSQSTYGSFENGQRSNSRASRKSNKFIDEAERLMGENSSIFSNQTSHADSESDLSSNVQNEGGEGQNTSTYFDYINVLCKEDLVCLIYLRFVALFCQTCLESSVPPIMQKYFNYGDQANSILYLLAGIELIVVFLILSVASKRCSDRFLICVGLGLMLFAVTWFLITLPSFTPGNRSNLPYFAVAVLFDLAGIPTVCDIGLSLYSKLMPNTMQGFGHGVRRFVSQVAIILGPLWGAGTLGDPLVMTIVPLILLAVGTLLFKISYKKMIPEERYINLSDELIIEREDN